MGKSAGTQPEGKQEKARRRDEATLGALSRACLALPEAVRQDMGQHTGFTVRKRTFAWYLNDHHGDGIVAIACKTALGENEEMARRDPERYYLPAYIGPKGWVGLRLDRGEVDWEEVAALVTASYCLVAPKKLAQEGLRRPPTTRLFESTDNKLGDEAKLFEAREDYVRPREPT